MIGYMKGTVEEILSDHILLEINGIGYRIFTSAMVLERLELHASKKMYTDLHVKEDGVVLYGFPTKEELALFRQLLGVNGIGPKAALSLLSTLTLQDLVLAVITGDSKTLTKANGVGAKAAARMIVELKDKLQLEDTFAGADTLDAAGEVHVPQGGNIQDAVLALVNLGYSDTEAYRAIRAIPDAANTEAEQLLKEALKKIY